MNYSEIQKLKKSELRELLAVANIKLATLERANATLLADVPAPLVVQFHNQITEMGFKTSTAVESWKDTDKKLIDGYWYVKISDL
mgnify:CR=1 FL=1|tara:strand:+ start:608 stop:862 length:255 start_codon:yes stop_codon:yes gene_type:complete